MQGYLRRIAEAYPRAHFGPPNITTARDIFRAARLTGTCSHASPDDVAAFLAWKFRDKRPWPYERGIQTFGGMLRMLAEDFGSWWLHSKRAPQVPPETNGASDASNSAPADEPELIPATGCAEHSFDAPWAEGEAPQPMRAPSPPPGRGLCRSYGSRVYPVVLSVKALDASSSGRCEGCSDKGYRLDDSGTEQVAGEEFKTISVSACNCSKGHQIGFRRLAEIERKEAQRRGPGWVAAHRPLDHWPDSITPTRNSVSRPRTTLAHRAGAQRGSSAFSPPVALPGTPPAG